MSFPRTRTEQLIPIELIRAAMPHRAVFFAGIALIYSTAIILATLTLNPYFAQTWDVQTFIQAGYQIADSHPFDLYAQSRAAQHWPYAYPPLHALVTAIALGLGNLLRIFPDYVWARVPTIIADVSVAWLLHSIVVRKTNDESLARVAAMLWLFNPITFYDTAVQGHFESEWLVLVLLAYHWLDEHRSIILPAIALALAVLFKQIAILLAMPVFVGLFVRWIADWNAGQVKRDNDSTRQRTNLILAPLVFTFVVIVICLPFLLYSDDFLFMNFTYVENVPVQTQSWIVALLGLTRDAPNALTSDFFLLRYQTSVTILAVLFVSFIAAQRGWHLYLTATLIAIVFFLTSKKVMGYYYVMLFPFLLATLVPHRRFNLIAIVLVATTYISLSPYYAAWTNHAHWWVYAILGIVNSAFFVWLGKKLTEDEGRRTEEKSSVSGLPSAIGLSLFTAAVFAALLQPLIANNGSPIRAPLIAPGIEVNALIALSALIILTLMTFAFLRFASSVEIKPVWGVGLLFAPLFFSVYTLTKESTAILEIALKTLGV